MYELPTAVAIDGNTYNITNKADYRTILGVIDCIQDPDLTKEERTISALLVFYDDLDDIEDIPRVFSDLNEPVKQMMKFIAGAYDDEEIPDKVKGIKLIDWKQDEKLIISAINNVAKTEIRALDYLHWWTFIGYYLAIGDCALANVVAIRQKIAKGKKLEPYEREFRKENPQYFVWKNQLIEQQNIINDIWNKGM